MSDAQLRLAAEILGPLVDEVVFVGGATIHLWLTDDAAPPARATDDVDVICDVTTRAAYYAIGERLRERDLVEVLNEPVVCRWRHRGSGLSIDVMPIAEDVLGFANRWYPQGLTTAVERTLSGGEVVRALSPPLVVGTKLEAWLGRGRGDVVVSHDVHDILVLVNGRVELADELADQAAELRRFIADELAALAALPYFDYAIQDVVRGYGPAAPARAAVVRERVDGILARLTEPAPAADHAGTLPEVYPPGDLESLRNEWDAPA